MASRDKVKFDNLLHHPLLLDSFERANFAVAGFERIGIETGWMEDYRSYEKIKYEGERKRNINIRNSIQSSKQHVAFNSIYERDKYIYQDNVVGVLNYTRNVLNHIGQHLTKTHDDLESQEIEEALTAMFPESLIDLYEFLVIHKNVNAGECTN
ncbi:hypothetical protein Pyn_10723 [Prunus yedoensis var. nudiflora]|uniref:Uncharacterized protein n=1 Tax=Prunus yedoensis var. nudiflora TaxID=2094558 RepID=A0A314Y1J9_PRUYE|nr:hypothetical protein Pyn_10723 [Prunus yedoensis var. nudiflora]